MHNLKKIKKIFGVIGVLITAVFISGCQPTPQKEVVVGKGEEGVEEMYKLAGVDQDSVSKEIDTDISYYSIPANKYDAPETYKTNLKRDNYSMHVNAAVIIPEYAMPIIEVQAAMIDYELIDEFIYLTTAHNDLYPIDVIDAIETKEIIQSQIDCAIYDLEYFSRPYDEIYDPEDPITQENVNDLIKSTKERIEELTIKLDTAPETFEEALNLLKEKGEFETLGGQKIYPTMLEPKEITSSNFDSLPHSIGAIDSDFNYTYYYIDATDKYNQQLRFKRWQPNYVNMPFGNADEEEAIAFAETYVDLLGEGLAIVDVEEDEYKYTLTYMRKYCGLNSALIFDSPSSVDMIGRTEIPYKQEQLVIQVSKKDPMFIKSVKYYSPLLVKNVLIRDANLLPFEEVMKIFKQYGTIYTFGAENELEIFIDRIQLEVMRVRKPNAEGEFLIVPVWNFYGTEISTWKGHDRTSENQNEHQSYLTINAIDGSIINIRLGH